MHGHTQSDYNGGSAFSAREAERLRKQLAFEVSQHRALIARRKQEEEDERLLALIRQLRHERTDPDTALNEIELLMGYPGAKRFWHRMIALRDWLRGERGARKGGAA
jgi:hypothetical protein